MMANSSAATVRSSPPESTRQTWIVDIVRRARLADSELLVIPASASTEEAWAKAAEVCRLRDDELTRHIADYFKLPVAQLSATDSHALKLVPEAVARRHKVLPLRQSDRQVVLATA